VCVCVCVYMYAYAHTHSSTFGIPVAPPVRGLRGRERANEWTGEKTGRHEGPT